MAAGDVFHYRLPVMCPCLFATNLKAEHLVLIRYQRAALWSTVASLRRSVPAGQPFAIATVASNVFCDSL